MPMSLPSTSLVLKNLHTPNIAKLEPFFVAGRK